MVRRMLFALTTLALVFGTASHAWAQLPKGYDLRFGWNGSVTESAHQDDFFFGVSRGFHQTSKGYLSAGGEIRIGHEFDFGGVQKYLGFVRYTDEKSLKWPCFINFYGGVEHFSGDTVGYLEPAAGMVFPWGWRDLKLFGQIALPIHLYSGNVEAGFGGQVGFTMPFMNK